MKYALLFAALLASPAFAQSQDEFSTAGVIECDETSSAEFIGEPWEKNTVTFADGAIRVAVLDYIEPAAAGYKLLVLSPPYDEVGFRKCRVIEHSEHYGFGLIQLEGHKASYDPKTGLTLTIPIGNYDVDTGGNKMSEMAVRINQSTGEITVKGNR